METVSEIRDDRPLETTSGDESWRRIECEVKEQVRAELKRDEATPLEVGTQIAWTEPGFKETTAGLTSVHRVGAPLLEFPRTLCGEMIPRVDRRVPLTPNFVRSLGRCRHCEELHAQRQRESTP